jgi:hypothetical protein
VRFWFSVNVTGLHLIEQSPPAQGISTAIIVLLVAASVFATTSFMVVLVLVRAFLMAPG